MFFPNTAHDVLAVAAAKLRRQNATTRINIERSTTKPWRRPWNVNSKNIDAKYRLVSLIRLDLDIIQFHWIIKVLLDRLAIISQL
jgi:hypothetical protein